MKSKAGKILNKQIEVAFYKHFDRVQVPIFELSKITEEVRRRAIQGQNLEVVMANLAAIYKQAQSVREITNAI
jgi:hypothetical protein